MLSPALVTPPAETPVSLAEARAHLRVEHDDDDALIEMLVAAATAYLDGTAGVLGRALITQTWRADFDGFPTCGYIRLPLAPIQSATVAYSDADNANQAFTDFALHGEATGPHLFLNSGASWPSTYSRQDALRVTFIAGYGLAAAVPAPLRAAILLMVGDLYANRETVAEGLSAIPMSTTVDALISPYRRFS